ncbi:hypothetical protein H5410_018472 [Solanum commersonii]|uniref:Uncharacterized protein n=1 Tax=Solanum commersonii TaxID=4109 RepID=A0A9J6A2I7_SOLCO|nr:hypothetical protein H5410_018472 [Solanum commersonii]
MVGIHHRHTSSRNLHDLGGSSEARVKYPYITSLVLGLISIKLIEGCKHELRVWKVNRERPPPNTFQLNTDGSALRTVPITSEVQQSSSWFIPRLNREQIRKWITHASPTSPEVAERIKDIHDSSTNLSFSKGKHTFREANSIADFLSKDGHNIDETQRFLHLPPTAYQRELCLGKMGEKQILC